MPGFIHRLFGRDAKKSCEALKGGPDLWDKGSPDAWYYHSKSYKSSHKSSVFKKWWGRSLLAHIGLELLVYLGCYYVIHAIARLALDRDRDGQSKSQFEEFEDIVEFFDKEVTPLSKDLTFLLGFYVSQIVKRWWDQFLTLPSPDRLALLCHGLVDFSHPEGMKWAKKLIRYAMLSYVLCLRRISKQLRGMFPSNSSLVSAGLATKKEIACVEEEGEPGQLWWIPLSWAMVMVRGSKEAKVVPSDQKILIDAVAKFQGSLEKIDSHDHIPLPPLYRQVVRFAVYVYFALALVSSQELEKNPYTFVPIFLILKFIFFFGWLEVAEALENPFGDDEDDFQTCELLSRHVWAVGRNLNQFRGPPEEEEEEEKEKEEKHIVTLQMDLHKKT